ncbi:MAG: Gfo/Idh/MocA family oxidoreductase [Armatimonadetes bacterium]|nr:Gfo/Idh/MocA family oxidoreductase [Armatimonadota bacterium]
MGNKIGFGLYGSGLVAPFHAKALQASEKARLVAVAARSPEPRAKLAAEFGCKACATLEEMLQDPEVQVVNILTPNNVHYDQVVACARAGRHVLVEKPPAVSLREIDGMDAECRQAGVKLGVVLQCRVRKPIQAMKHAIEAGRFGRILHADTIMKWYRAEDYYFMNPWRSSRRAGAGVTIQHAFHYVDLLQYLAGPVRQVYARMTNLTHPRVELEDTLLAIVDYESGAQGVVEASTALFPGTDLRVEINGENGTAIMVGEHMEVWKFKDERPEDEGIRRLGDASQATAASGPAAFGFCDHQVVIDDMAECVHAGREPVIPVMSVRPTLEWALAMYQSAKEGAAVSLPVTDEEAAWG